MTEPQTSPRRRTARAIMFQGTGSDVGKSLLVAGFCRAMVRRGLRVRPFKPQNMSNNAAVTADGGEIGRAQALQARACGVAPSVLMNPVLLKPQSDIGSQVVVCGQVIGSASARDYYRLKPSLLPQVLASFDRLGEDCDLLVVEGAGSAAEVNLRAADIANMGFAEAADVPVVLVGDIDRGGVLAQLVGTHALLPEAERARIGAFLVNKFRGDPALFADGVRLVTERTGWRSAGVIPWFAAAARLPAEDAMALPTVAPVVAGAQGEARLRVVVPRLSRIANFDDFDPLAQEPGVELIFVPPGSPLPLADLVILPGSKSTRADLDFLRAQGWDHDLLAHARRGGAVIGICAGFQMLGRVVRDPSGVEGPAGETAGLGLLDLETTMEGAKVLCEVQATDLISGQSLRGYEMHMGRTSGAALAQPWLRLQETTAEGELRERCEGAQQGRIAGCYLHGLFGEDGFRHHLLASLQQQAPAGAALAYQAQVEATLDALADHLETFVDCEALLALAR